MKLPVVPMKNKITLFKLAMRFKFITHQAIFQTTK